MPRTLIRLREEFGVEALDRLWLFPPVRKGRREQGLVAFATYLAHDERRGLVTMSYVAEHTGTGVTIEPSFSDEGEAPPDRFAGMMEGVVRRGGGGEGQGEPREVVIEGSAEAFEELLEEFDEQFLEARDA